MLLIKIPGGHTYGGFSESIVVDENYVVHVPETLPLDQAAPILCAGITVYSPLKHWKAGPGKHIGIIGMGGLGHMAIKIAKGHGSHSNGVYYHRVKGCRCESSGSG